MSHYRSGRYYVELDKRKAIENECQQKLQQAQREQEAALANAQRVRQELANNEEQLSIQAQQLRQDMQKDRQQLQEELLRQRQQAKAKLDQLDMAVRRLTTVYRSDPIAQDLQNRLEQLHEMYQLGHYPAERVADMEKIDLKAWEGTLRARADERVNQESAAHLSRISGTAGDYSEKFVSLQKKNAKQQIARKTPWETFCRRVQALVEQQQDMADEALLRLSEEMENVAPSFQKKFMIDNEQLLADLEAEAAEMADMLRQSTDELDRQVRRYEALCGLLQLKPQHRFTAGQPDYALLTAENERLWQRYLLQQEEEYVHRNLEEVFTKYGIRFDNLETAAAEDGTIQMHCELSGSASLTMTKSSGGAFEMEFSGVSSSATVSMDERRRVVEEAKSFCSLMPQISAELKARGILIDASYQEEPTVETIRIEQRAVRQVTHKKEALRTMK